MSAAMKRAQAEGKDLMLNFTGSDWCHWCHVLEEEVFDTKLFKEKAPKNFVLVTLDFPADEAKQNPKLAKQNHEWLEKLGVEGFPTIVLCDAEGRPYATLGYAQGGPKPYVESLDRAVDSRKKRDRLMAEATKLKGVEKAKKLDEALSQIDRILVAQSYKPIVKEILTLASADKSLTAKYESLELVGKQRAALAEMEALAMMKESKKVRARLAEMAELFNEESEEQSEFEFMRLEVLTEVKLHDEAIEAARKMIKSNPKSFEAGMARETILENLIGLGKPDEVLESVEKWTKDADVVAAFELSVYKVDALLAMGKKTKAISVAAELSRDAKKNQELRDGYVVEWLNSFVTVSYTHLTLPTKA